MKHPAHAWILKYRIDTCYSIVCLPTLVHPNFTMGNMYFDMLHGMLNTVKAQIINPLRDIALANPGLLKIKLRDAFRGYSYLEMLRVPPYERDEETDQAHGVKLVLDGNGCVQLLNALRKRLLAELFDVDVKAHAQESLAAEAALAESRAGIRKRNAASMKCAEKAKHAGDTLQAAREARNVVKAKALREEPCSCPAPSEDEPEPARVPVTCSQCALEKPGDRELEWRGMEKLHRAAMEPDLIVQPEMAFVVVNGVRQRVQKKQKKTGTVSKAAQLAYQRQQCGTAFMGMVVHLGNALALAMTLQDKPGVDYETGVIQRYEAEITAFHRIVNTKMTTRNLGVIMTLEGPALCNWPCVLGNTTCSLPPV